MRSMARAPKPSAPRPGPPTVAAAIEGEFEAVMRRGLDAAGSSAAALALALAREVDDPHNSATSKAMCAGRLLDVLRLLRASAPAENAADRVDDLAARRTVRLARAAK